MNSNTSKKARIAALAAAAGIGLTALVGVGAASATTQAQPAPAMSHSQQVQTNDGPIVKVVQGRVALTVKNTTDKPITVYMNGHSITGEVTKTLAPGETLRAAGATLSSGKDVEGYITFANGSKVALWGYNPDIGYPSVGFNDFGASGYGTWERFYENETQSFERAGHTFDVTRGTDHDMVKDFQISVKS